MIHRRRQPARRAGVTLLEVMAAVSLSATMMTSSFAVLRSSYAAWQAHEADLDRAANATAVLRHIVRNARQAVGVTAISASGDLSIVDYDGATLTWDHNASSVTLQIDSGTLLPVADDIQDLSFEGYLADGVTPAADPDDVQTIRAAVTTLQPAGGSRTISSFIWIRSW